MAGDNTNASSRNKWRTPDVWSIALSAFFADLGYQSVLASFPLFLVIYLNKPVWEYGLAMALSYGGGAIFSLIGAKIGDRVGHRKLAITGNLLIPLLSLSALIANPTWAIGMLVGGWWARNLRSPSRRVMLNEAVVEDRHRTRIFGFLHALDVGGAAAAAIFVIIAIRYGVSFRTLFLLTVIPLLISSLMLARAKTGRPNSQLGPNRNDIKQVAQDKLNRAAGARAIFISSALYGFTFYSIGFPILTVAQKTNSNVLGIAAFLVFQASSAATGYFLAKTLAKTLIRGFMNLGLLGYLVSALGALALIIDVNFHLGAFGFLGSMVLLGFALGVIETLEPSLVAVLSQSGSIGKKFGNLSASRSVGLFTGNLVMGVLYQLGPSWSYGYSALMATAAAGIMVLAAGIFKRGAIEISVTSR